MKRKRTLMPAFAGMTVSLFLQVRGLNHRRERPELKTGRNDRNGFIAVHCGRCNRLGCNGNRERFLAALEMTAAIQVLWVSSRTQVRDLSRASSVVDRWASNVCRLPMPYQTAPSLRAAAISASLQPTMDFRISSVCSPSEGEGFTSVGESDNLIGLPTVRYLPRLG